MTTPPKDVFSIKANYLGPIFTLSGDLTKHDQNLIFARNGSGKSFLSRALRHLDLFAQGRDISDAAKNLISDEASNGNGAFSFSRGTSILGSLHLEKQVDQVNEVSARVTDTIFHVFSEDFVQDELRENEYQIDGEIENQISVDSEDIKIKDTQDSLDKAIAEKDHARVALCEKYDVEKGTELGGKARINKQLKEYRALSLDGLLEHYTEKPEPPEQCFADILKDLGSLKKIPAEPVYPDILSSIKNDDIELGSLDASLQRVTSLSSVSDKIKEKIENHHGFYETGAKIIQDEARTTCPLCEQGITDPGPKAIIDAYIAYFEDEEEKHRAELRGFSHKLQQKEAELKDAESQVARQKLRFNTLKQFVPSRRDTEINDGELEFKEARTVITSRKNAIEEKKGALSAPHPLPSADLAASIDGINKVIEKNNTKVSELNKAVEKSEEERKDLQRDACTVFDREFAIRLWSDIAALKALKGAINSKRDELNILKDSNPSPEARARVAKTFKLLLKEFFANKYVFDEDKFVLKRGDHEMARGPHRTLSDGEKAAVAFCYFIACVHRKVASNSDYRNLFLVFDDPVTSMSYDFVFAIAQTLRHLSISNMGEVSITPSKIDGNKCVRPKLLILTHSSYFFNISRTNKVVKDDATFSLSTDGDKHKLSHMRSYLAPFEQQLAHVYHVANGNNPDHSTGNAIRCVLEAVGRFCRPDKSQSLADFVSYLAGEEDFAIKSTMINSLSHGTYYDECPTVDDLKQACEETLSVVEKYASGQIAIIKSQP